MVIKSKKWLPTRRLVTTLKLLSSDTTGYYGY